MHAIHSLLAANPGCEQARDKFNYINLRQVCNKYSRTVSLGNVNQSEQRILYLITN